MIRRGISRPPRPSWFACLNNSGWLLMSSSRREQLWRRLLNCFVAPGLPCFPVYREPNGECVVRMGGGEGGEGEACADCGYRNSFISRVHRAPAFGHGLPVTQGNNGACFAMVRLLGTADVEIAAKTDSVSRRAFTMTDSRSVVRETRRFRRSLLARRQTLDEYSPKHVTMFSEKCCH